MASIARYKGQWRAQIYMQGHRESKVFEYLRDAKEWAQQQEAFREWPTVRVLSIEEMRQLQTVGAINAHPGVYFLWDVNVNLAYVGQSRNVAARVKRHKLEPPVAFQHATCLSIPAPWQLAVEYLYLAKYGQPGKSADAIRDLGNRIESYVPGRPAASA